MGEWKSVDVMALGGGWDVVFPVSLDSGSGKELINRVCCPAAQHLMCALLSGPAGRDPTLIPVRAFSMEKEKSTFDQSAAGRSSPWQGAFATSCL